MKKIMCVFILAVISSINMVYAEPVTVLNKQNTQTYIQKQTPLKPSVQAVEPLSLVNNPQLYLNKTITFSGEFVSFTSLGLDYKPAFRDGTKYIGILMRRPDSKNNVIPLSELKMFMKRELAEKNIDMEAGDIFNLTGKVFSTALGDPWLDITEFKITSKKNKVEKNK